MELLDRRIDEATEMLLNLAIAESEHPTEAGFRDAFNEVVFQLNTLVQLRAGVKQLPR